MSRSRLYALLAAVAGPPADDRADADLLARFAADRDELAFEVLVWRHGPMVRAVCRAVLGNPADADDAFQATFLVLARKAGTVRRADAVGGWLYGVAGRVARKLKRRLARRERLAEDLTMVPAADRPAPAPDLRAAIDAEIARLPEKYRFPVQLCYVAGHTTAEAAARLGWPKGTVLSRLAWARRRLQDRLTRRGIAPGVGAIGAAAALDPTLVRATVKAATAAAGGLGVLPIVSESTLHLSEGVIREMALIKLRLVVGTVVVAVAAAGVGVGRWAVPATAGADDKPTVAEKKTAPPKRAEPPRTPVPAPPPGASGGLEPDGERYAEAMRRIEQLEKELKQLRDEAKRTAPVMPPPPAAPVDLPTLTPASTPVPSAAMPALPTPVPAALELPPPPAVAPRPAPSPPLAAVPPVKDAAGRQADTFQRAAGGHTFALTFHGKRLKAVNTVAGENGPLTVTIDADYSVTEDGVLYGYITAVDTDPPADDVTAPVIADIPFAFRFRADDGVLTIRDVKLTTGSTLPADTILFAPGRYTAAGMTGGLVAPLVRPQPPASPPRRVRPPAAAPQPSIYPVAPVGTPDPPPAGGPTIPPSNVPGPTAQPMPAGNDPFRRPDGSNRLIPSSQPRPEPLPTPPIGYPTNRD